MTSRYFLVVVLMPRWFLCPGEYGRWPRGDFSQGRYFEVWPEYLGYGVSIPTYVHFLSWIERAGSRACSPSPTQPTHKKESRARNNTSHSPPLPAACCLRRRAPTAVLPAAAATSTHSPRPAPPFPPTGAALPILRSCRKEYSKYHRRCCRCVVTCIRCRRPT